MPPKKAGKAAKAGKKPRAKKDPNAPKRAIPAYFFFMMEKRAEITKKNPSIKSVTEISTMVVEEWRKMTPQQKTPYEKMAEQDKLRYQKEMAAYKKTGKK